MSIVTMSYRETNTAERILSARNARQVQTLLNTLDLHYCIIKSGKAWALTDRGNVEATGDFDYIKQRAARVAERA